MFQPLAICIGLCYTRAKRKNHFISFISAISVGGIALGITTMIVVLSVMNGFQHEVRERTLAMTAHASVVSWQGNLQQWQDVAQIVKEQPEVLGVAPYIKGQGLLSVGVDVKPVELRGIDPNYEDAVSDISKKLSAVDEGLGELSHLVAGEFGVVLGSDLAKQLNVTVGDKVSLITSELNVTAAGILPRIKRMTVVGIFHLGMYEYDAHIALLHIADAGKLLRYADGEVQALRVKLDNVIESRRVAQDIANRLGEGYVVFDWTQEFASLFRMIQIEKISMMVIMSLIVAVAVFNVVSTLVMAVTDKRADIAILRTLGLSPAQIMIIFMVQGTVIGFLGAVIGLLMGVLIAANVSQIVRWIEALSQQSLFAPDIYPLSELPSIIYFSDVVSVSLIAFGMASLATLYPSWKAAKTQPAEALRYE